MNNKLIAEFMDFPKEMPDNLVCEYHTSWDELMPVVEKINTNYNIKIDIGHEWVEVRGSVERMFLYDITINLAYKAVIYIIKEINKSNEV